MNSLYRYRGWVLGFFSLLLLLLPPTRGYFSVSAVLLILSGVALRIEARRSIGEHTRENALSADFLVQTGVYAHLRHPLYLSNIMISCGFILIHLGWSTMTFAFSGLVIAFIYALSLQEDRFLQVKFGESWVLWKDKTKAFLPTKQELKPTNAKKRSIRKAFFADLSTWGWLLFFSLLLILRRNIGDMI